MLNFISTGNSALWFVSLPHESHRGITMDCVYDGGKECLRSSLDVMALVAGMCESIVGPDIGSKVGRLPEGSASTWLPGGT